jgi:hypothetical protein
MRIGLDVAHDVGKQAPLSLHDAKEKGVQSSARSARVGELPQQLPPRCVEQRR